MDPQLMAMAAEGKRQRYYVAANEGHEKAADVSRPVDMPDAEMPNNPRWFSPPAYGMTGYADLFTARQAVALTTFSDLIGEARAKVANDSGNSGYADAIATYLAFAISKLADRGSSICSWVIQRESNRNTFARQAIPMTWDFIEMNPLLRGTGSFAGAAAWTIESLEGAATRGAARVMQADAATCATGGAIVSTDPPYYDNIGYADLSDFFYVWLRRSLRDYYPDLLATMLTPKAKELIATPYRFNGSKNKAEEFFEDGFLRTFTRIREEQPKGFPATVIYAFKQSETTDEGEASTGWERMLSGLLEAGYSVTATWPIQTERATRSIDIGTNALASSIVLACRPRPADAAFTDRRGFIDTLQVEFPEALRRLEQGKIAPVDLRQAAIGPGMAVFSRYARVNEPDGSPMRVRAALSLINQVLDEKLSQLVGDVSADTRFCVEWFKQYGFEEGPFGTADTLARGVDTGVDGLVRAGILRSAAGKVKLRSVADIPDAYDPAADERMSEWEVCLHLAKQLDEHGTDAAARLLAAARDVPGIDLDDVRELAYLLYSIAEKRNWAEVGLLFNNLGTLWMDLEDTARRVPSGAHAGGQGQLTLEFGSDDDGGE